MRRWVLIGFGLSLVLNLILLGLIVDQALRGYPESATGELRRLTRDIEVGRFNETNTIFTLPKGLVVRDASASGMDWFEPYRFRLVITTDDSSLLEDFSDPDGATRDGSEYYSADVELRRRQQEAIADK